MKIYRSESRDDPSVDESHREEIEKGVEEARAGRLVDYESVKRHWTKRLSQEKLNQYVASSVSSEHGGSQ